MIQKIQEKKNQDLYLFCCLLKVFILLNTHRDSIISENEEKKKHENN
jgi:hypothetical protein